MYIWFFIHFYLPTVLFQSRWCESMHASWKIFVCIPKYIFEGPYVQMNFISLLAEFHNHKKQATYLKISASRAFKSLKNKPWFTVSALASASSFIYAEYLISDSLHRSTSISLFLVFESPVPRLEKDRDWTRPRPEKTRPAVQVFDNQRLEKDRSEPVNLYPQFTPSKKAQDHPKPLIFGWEIK